MTANQEKNPIAFFPRPAILQPLLSQEPCRSPPKRIRFNPVAQELFYFLPRTGTNCQTEALGKLSQLQSYNFHLA